MDSLPLLSTQGGSGTPSSPDRHRFREKAPARQRGEQSVTGDGPGSAGVSWAKQIRQ